MKVEHISAHAMIASRAMSGSKSHVAEPENNRPQRTIASIQGNSGNNTQLCKYVWGLGQTGVNEGCEFARNKRANHDSEQTEITTVHFVALILLLLSRTRFRSETPEYT